MSEKAGRPAKNGTVGRYGYRVTNKFCYKLFECKNYIPNEACNRTHWSPGIVKNSILTIETYDVKLSVVQGVKI